MTKGEPGKRLATAMSLMGIGWYFAFSIVGGIVGGWLLDGWLGTEPLFTLLGLLLGMIVAFYGGLKTLMRVMSETSETTKGPEDN